MRAETIYAHQYMIFVWYARKGLEALGGTPMHIYFEGKIRQCTPTRAKKKALPNRTLFHIHVRLLHGLTPYSDEIMGTPERLLHGTWTNAPFQPSSSKLACRGSATQAVGHVL